MAGYVEDLWEESVTSHGYGRLIKAKLSNVVIIASIKHTEFKLNLLVEAHFKDTLTTWARARGFTPRPMQPTPSWIKLEERGSLSSVSLRDHLWQNISRYIGAHNSFNTCMPSIIILPPDGWETI